ncbi:MAG: acetyl-CoA carboxylase subunit beta [Deltaproteobacteria bacterium RBG_19FT_COMBO_60_16]|nr:MAG: acetyl-CoA carboxylase subunit beta [Deltaproteobacteria bacterium RBG_16_64_85]OGP99950.1 MAG: acetyl-CoA carboxylase subunit beta [Deltaproteobacteria bacterium RBG_19FT_COMBO_60_16]
MRLFRRKEEGEKKTKIPEGMWIKCNACLEIIYKPEVERNLNVCPKCNYHFRIPAMERIRAVTDEGTFQEFGEDLESVDMLSFTDTKKYTDRLKEAKKKTGRKEAVITGAAKINGIDIVLAVLDFEFLGGSMGCVVGEKVAVAAEAAKELSRPLIIFSASGGARMQEGTLSLMQMAKTSAALAKLSDARIPFLSVLTDPTTGGVAASFAMLGDIIISEPGALIGFAGPRVIEQTIKQKLPEGFQRAEFLLEHGMIDIIVERTRLKPTLTQVLRFLTAPPGK